MKTVEESEVFEINDFTTASEWERFVARIEEVLQEWKLTSQHQHQQSCPQPQYKPHFSKTSREGRKQHWEERTANINYADYTFALTLHKLVTPHDNHDMGDGKKERMNKGVNELEKEGGGKLGNKEREAPLGETTNRQDSSSEDSFRMPTAWQEMMANDDLFPTRAHCLHRWFGLDHFVVMATVTGGEDVNSESRVNMLLSSLSLAVHNTGCETSMFVQAGQKWRRLFHGVLEAGGFRSCFEMVQLKRCLERHRYLGGLLHIFKEKIASTVAKKAIATIDVHFTYAISDWLNFPCMTPPPDIEDMNDGMVAGTFNDLSFGCYDDPIGDLMLSCTWSGLSEEMVVETDAYSDLDPMLAPDWSARVRMNDDSETILGGYLKSFVQLCRKNDPAFSLHKPPHTDMNPSIALDRLTEPVVPTLAHVVKKATSRLAANQAAQSSDAIHKLLLDRMILFLFPDAQQADEAGAHENNQKNNNKNNENNNNGNNNNGNNNNNNDENRDEKKSCYAQEFEDLSKQLKAAEADSLSSRLAVCLCYVNHSRGGIKGVVQLWEEFVLEMRFRWENNTIIPGLERGPPDMSACLLHQKLQMLNCCIERKQTREKAYQKASSSTNQDTASEDDEFYECHDEDEGKKENEASRDAEGRLRLLDANIRLLASPKRYAYVPVTQEPAPMTEDLLEQHAEVLSRLGTTQESSQLRARMQSACLLSDMEAFKAANPGALLEDFVRWYSPRDWIEKEVGKGHLSQRMRIDGNMWMETWQNARGVPVSRQRRLFDDTKEAEKVLHWLSSLRAQDLALQALPMLMLYAVGKVLQSDECRLPFLEASMKKLKQRVVEATRSGGCGGGSLEVLKAYEEAVQMLNQLEVGVAKARSLIYKLKLVNNQSRDDSSTNYLPADRPIKNEKEIDQFVSSILEFPEVSISSRDSMLSASSSPVGRLVFKLFLHAAQSDSQSTDTKKIRPSTTSHRDINKLPRPIGKEYVFRLVCNRPAPWSRLCPQRMYCVITNDEFRLSGAFTNDTIFF